MDDTTRQAAEQAAGLRALADLIEANPDLAPILDGLGRIHSYILPDDDPKQLLAAFARAAVKHGATVTKDFAGGEDEYFALDVRFGPITIYAYSDREEVCERVVVGTETVTEMVKDPEALAAVPEVEQTVEREIVEWRCTPLLADATGGAS